MASSLLESFLSAVQSALSVLLILAYGVGAAKAGLLSSKTATDISHVCIEMFLPALLVTSMGKDLAKEGSHVIELWPIVVWAIVYPFISLFLVWPAVKWLRFPTWFLAAAPFNNTTALPLLLLQSLSTTGILDSISQGDPTGAVENATTYFLLNAMVNNVITFGLGPRVLGDSDPDDDAVSPDGNTPGGLYPDPLITANIIEDGEEDLTVAEEDTPLLSKRIVMPLKRTTDSIARHLINAFHKLPAWLQEALVTIRNLFNPPLVGACLAVLIGLTPPLSRAFFSSPQDGGVLKAWFTSSLQNIGNLFNALQMFVVGSKLYDSVASHSKKRQNDDAEESRAQRDLPQDIEVRFWPVAYVLLVRFAIMPLISIGLVYILASKTDLLGNNAMMWFVLMFAPSGPPAINIASLAEVAGESELVQQAIARFLTISYAITPVVCFAVVGALRSTEAALESKGK